MTDDQTATSNRSTAPGEPEPIGAIAERVLNDLATRRREALRRLARAHRPIDRKDQP